MVYKFCIPNDRICRVEYGQTDGLPDVAATPFAGKKYENVHKNKSAPASVRRQRNLVHFGVERERERAKERERGLITQTALRKAISHLRPHPFSWLYSMVQQD